MSLFSIVYGLCYTKWLNLFIVPSLYQAVLNANDIKINNADPMLKEVTV